MIPTGAIFVTKDQVSYFSIIVEMLFYKMLFLISRYQVADLS